MVDCYRDLGLHVEQDPDDETLYSVDPGAAGAEAMAEATERCQDKIGEWRLPDGYVEEMYEHSLRQRECLIELGYEPSPPPSFEVFAEHRDWDPFGEVVDATDLRPPEYFEVREQCPYFQDTAAGGG